MRKGHKSLISSESRSEEIVETRQDEAGKIRALCNPRSERGIFYYRGDELPGSPEFERTIELIFDRFNSLRKSHRAAQSAKTRNALDGASRF